MVFLPTLDFFAHASLDLHLSFSSVRGWGGGMGGGGGVATDSRVPRRHTAKLLHWLAMICRKEIPIHLVKGNKAFRESPLAELLLLRPSGESSACNSQE